MLITTTYARMFFKNARLADDGEWYVYIDSDWHLLSGSGYVRNGFYTWKWVGKNE